VQSFITSVNNFTCKTKTSRERIVQQVGILILQPITEVLHQSTRNGVIVSKDRARKTQTPNPTEQIYQTLDVILPLFVN
jgi:hypothetical protein